LAILTTIDEKFRNTVGEFPDKIALIYKEEKFTFNELDQLVNQLANGLAGKGVGKQDKVIIYLPHMSQWIISWFALQRIGAVAVPVSHFYGHDILHYIAKDCGAETIFCSEANVEHVRLAWPNSFLKNIIIADAADHEDVKDSSGEISLAAATFESYLGTEAPPRSAIEIEGKDMAEILYTSGTTGLPKGVTISNIYLLEQIFESKKQSELIIPMGEGITIQGAPLNHILGQELGLGSLLSGDTLVLLAQMNLDNLLEHIEKFKATTFFGTPTLCRMILEHDKLDQYNLTSLRYVFTGGETLPVEVAKNWAQKFGHTLYNGYGSTETSGGISGVIAGRPFPEGTAGKILPNKRVKLVNPETLETVPGGEAGELLIFAENMAKGYWNSPEETAKRYIYLDGTTWYRTGDVVQIDEEGWLFFKERSVDLIKHKGYRVAPSKIEGVLYKHKAVSGCCAVGIPDKYVGEKIKVFVVLKSGAEDITHDELIEWCRERLVSYEVPHYIEFRDDLPKAPSGKILRRKLREEELAKESENIS